MNEYDSKRLARVEAKVNALAVVLTVVLYLMAAPVLSGYVVQHFGWSKDLANAAAGVVVVAFIWLANRGFIGL